MEHKDQSTWYGTTILCVRKGDNVVMAGDGQVSIGQTVMKSNARKVRRIGNTLLPSNNIILVFIF